jgi:hypothetical protein
MTLANFQAIVNALPKPAALYGVRLISGKDIILSENYDYNSKQTITWTIDADTATLKFKGLAQTGMGPQIQIERHVDIGSITEVMTYPSDAKDAAPTE